MTARTLNRFDSCKTGPSEVTITDSTNHYVYRVRGLEITQQASLFQCGLMDIMGIESTSEKLGLGLRITWTATDRKSKKTKKGICDFLPRRPNVRD